MSWILPGLFAVTALLYAAVGFGGGSTYNALLVLSGTNYLILPAISLACNIIVVSGGVWRFSQSGALSLRRFWPFLALSMPAAWIGGRLPVPEQVFVGLLGLALLASGLRLLLAPTMGSSDLTRLTQAPIWLSLFAGAAIGFLAGIVGIGGGIFLAPILYLLKWGTARQIAGACSLFILANSVFGLAGQLSKLGNMDALSAALPYWPLLIAVFVGGQIGSWFGAGKLETKWMKRLTAGLILYVAARLLWRFIQIV